MSQNVTTLRGHVPPGAGVGLRHQLWDQTLAHAEAFDFVEITIDDYMHVPISHLKKWFAPVRERWSTIVAHGVGLSLGSSHGLDQQYIDHVGRILDALGIEVYTEHLSWRRSQQVEIGQFMPTPFTEGWAEQLAHHIQHTQRCLGRTMAVENITYLLGTFDSGIGEARYIRQVLEHADCGLLLDVTNLLINCANLHADPNEWAKHIPRERIALAHMAGGHIDQHHYIDSHGHPIPQPVYHALSWFGAHSPICSGLLERDKNWPTIDALKQEVAQIRDALTATAPDKIPTLPTQLPPVDHSCHGTDLDAGLDAIDPVMLQQTQAYLLQHPNDGLKARKTGQLPTALTTEFMARGLDHQTEKRLVDYLLTIPKRRWMIFQKILRFKRREKLEGVMPGTFRALQERDLITSCLDQYYAHQPNQGLDRVEDATELAMFIQHAMAEEPLICDLATHEMHVLRLRQHPWRVWHRLTPWRGRTSATLSHHAEDLDNYAHRHDNATLRQGHFIAHYQRKSRGVFVHVLPAKSRF